VVVAAKKFLPGVSHLADITQGISTQHIAEAVIYENKSAQQHIEAYGKLNRQFIQKLIVREPTTKNA